MRIPEAKVQAYIERFNADDTEWYRNCYDNAAAWDFLRDRIPRFECPDTTLETVYYFRWWTFRKHLRETPHGFVVTEFLPEVPWSRAYNTINCPAMHHFREGRWLRDSRYLFDYQAFWLGDESSPRQYSFPLATSLWEFFRVHGDFTPLAAALDRLTDNYRGWEAEYRTPGGLFRQTDNMDGMEVSIGGDGWRATLNSYMYGDAVAIARIARLAGREELSREFSAKAETLRQLVLECLWDEEAAFFKVAREAEGYRLAAVRELHGFTPWYVELPPRGAGYERAWRELQDPRGFKAPYGPTTAEQRSPEFKLAYEGHECQWNGPSWPYATSVTLTALGNVLQDYPQSAVSAADFCEVLGGYARSHFRTLPDGRRVPWIDENLNPYTGEWISRTRLASWENGTWSEAKGGVERGKDYNHSTFNDLVIHDLVGLRPQAGGGLWCAPLLAAENWTYCALENVRIQGCDVSVYWDQDGSRYRQGRGLRIVCDGRLVARSETLEKLKIF